MQEGVSAEALGMEPTVRMGVAAKGSAQAVAWSVEELDQVIMPIFVAMV